MKTSTKNGSNSPNYKLPRQRCRCAVEHADATVHVSHCCAGKVLVHVNDNLLEAPGEFCREPPCHGDAQLSSLTTPQRSRPTSVDSGASFYSVAQVQSPPGASLGAAILNDDDTGEEAELRREQEQEQARRLCAAKANDTRAGSIAAQDAANDDEAWEDEARRAEQIQMLTLLKTHNLLDTLETRCEAEQRVQQRSGKAMFHSQAGDLCRDLRLEVLDTADSVRGRVSRI